MDTEGKVIDDKVPDDEPHRVDEKELRIYRSTDSVFDIVD